MLRTFTALILLLGSIPVVRAADGPELVPLTIRAPRPPTICYARARPWGVQTDPEWKPGLPPAKVLAPKDAVNLAARRPVTSSDMRPIIGRLLQVTDGDIELVEGSWVELMPGKQWVQIDLGRRARVYGIVVHRPGYGYWRAYRDVVIQVSSDPDFARDVTTLFNNDRNNTLGFGKGADWEYFEDAAPKVIDAQGTMARYVRLWSNGNTTDDQNHYTEVEAWGMPVEPLAEAESAPLNFTFPRPAYERVWTPPVGSDLNPEWVKAPVIPEIAAPKDAANLALQNRVPTRAVARAGKPRMVTDGRKDADPDGVLELPAGKQWIQVDLGQRCSVYAVLLWHRHDGPRVYPRVVVQASDDPTFSRGVQQLLNTDRQNKLGLGKQDEYPYLESHRGQAIETNGLRFRYLRLWSDGNTADDRNHYTEVEVWGTPAR
jgi:hypothetical protein